MKEILRNRSGISYLEPPSEQNTKPENLREKISDWKNLKQEAEIDSDLEKKDPDKELFDATPVNKEEIRYMVLQASGLSLVINIEKGVFTTIMEELWIMSINIEAIRQLSKYTKAQIEKALVSSRLPHENEDEEGMISLEKALKE